MDLRGYQPSYEVFCNRCHVSFPVGARRCIHCGGPLSRQRLERESTPQRGLGPGPELEEEEPTGETGLRHRAFSPVALLWIALAVAMTLYRACIEGAR